MPFDEEKGASKGFALIEFTTPQEAAAAIEQTNGYKLDKNHVFAVNFISQYDKYMQVPDEYEPVAVKEYNPIENMHSWLVDERGRDQFAVRYLDWTEVFWNDSKRSQADQVYQRKFWTESFIEWSPKGYFLTTVHRPGAAIWGGPEFTRLNRYAHPGVQLLDFSPREEYLVTFSTQKPTNPRDSQSVTLKVWDVRSGRSAPLRTFEGPAQDYYDVASGGDIQWPIFKWSGGDQGAQYFAKMSKNSISVYEAPSMGLLDKKSIKLEGVEHFSWSPTGPLMAVFIPEQQRGNQPARVALIEIPSKKEIRQKQLFSVHELKLHWHPGGQYLAAVVSRFTKTKKSTYSGFELFRIEERDIAIEVMELDNKTDKVVDFAWEPKGHNFIVIHGDGARPDTSVYTMKDSAVKGGGNVKKRGTFKGKSANQIFWSPQGRFCVLAGLKGLNGQLEFFNAEDMETMATAEHFMCTEVAWDPTGRFVATSVTAVHQMENGFNIWSFNGKLIYRLPRERFFQFLWRPRPPTLLSPEKEAEIQKNLKKYSKKYEEEDELVAKGQDEEVMKERMRALDEWMVWHKDRLEEIESIRSAKYEIRGYDSDTDVWAVEEEKEEEELLNIHEEIVDTF